MYPRIKRSGSALPSKIRITWFNPLNDKVFGVGCPTRKDNAVHTGANCIVLVAEQQLGWSKYTYLNPPIRLGITRKKIITTIGRSIVEEKRKGNKQAGTIAISIIRSLLVFIWGGFSVWSL